MAKVTGTELTCLEAFCRGGGAECSYNQKASNTSNIGLGERGRGEKDRETVRRWREMSERLVYNEGIAAIAAREVETMTIGGSRIAKGEGQQKAEPAQEFWSEEEGWVRDEW